MGRTWVLHTETKGTGAHMVPLEKSRGSAEPEAPIFVPRKPRRRPEPETPQPKPPHRFRIVDVMTRATLVEDADAHTAVETLRPLGRMVDVNVYVWHEERTRWRLLTLEEQRSLWTVSRS